MKNENEKFLEKYKKQTVGELIQLEDKYRIDSLVLAFEEAINQKAARIGIDNLTKLEKSVLAIEALEREVNNGGYDQFFVNSPEFAIDIVDQLKYVGLPKTAEITKKAIDELKIDGPLTIEKINNALAIEDNGREAMFGLLNDAFYEYEENISHILFQFIKDNQDKIHLP